MPRNRFDSFSDDLGNSIYVRAVGAVLGFLFSGWCLYDLVDILDSSEIVAVEAFRREPKDNITALVLASGVEYLGSCTTHGPSFRSCPPAAAAGELCRSREDMTIPPPVRPVAGAAQPAPPRRLPGAATVSCQDRYVPWLLVSWLEGERNVTRCAYEWGSRAGSERYDTHVEQAVKQLSTLYPVESEAHVWAQRAWDRCVVGFGSLREEAEYVRTHVTWGFLVVKFLLAMCCCAPVAWPVFSSRCQDESGFKREGSTNDLGLIEGE